MGGRGHEPKELLDEETGASLTDLTKVRQERLRLLESAKDDDKVARPSAEPIRNHGLFSKAEVALGLAGWSPKARADIEVLPLVQTDGLTPLLMVLNQRVNLATARAGDPGSTAMVCRRRTSAVRPHGSRLPVRTPPLDAGHHALHFALTQLCVAGRE